MEVTVAKQKRKDQLSMDGHHKTKLMMVPVTVWISTDRVNVAYMNMSLVHMDLDVLTMLVNNSLIRTSYFCMDLLIYGSMFIRIYKILFYRSDLQYYLAKL